MSRFTQLIAVSLIGLALPFTAWGLSTGVDAQQAGSVWRGGLDTSELPPGVEPPQCKLEARADGEQVDAQPTACCWFLWAGRWWCVAC